jgi:general secretion pathway protein J
MTRFRSAEAGFTLIEMLISTALFLLVVSALASVTAEWLPNWNRGFVRVQRTEKLALGLDRIAADLAAAEFIPPNGRTTAPLFYGTELSVTFVRTAVGPNSAPGLEIVRLAEVADKDGPLLVREAIPFVPLDPNALATLKFPDSAVLIHPPYRVEFSYAGLDRAWRKTWHDGDIIPSAVRVLVRNEVTGRLLADSTAIEIHDNAAAGCTNGNGNCGVIPGRAPNGAQPGGATVN